jgi:hypothetical protein
LGGLVELQLGDVRVSGLLGWFCSGAFLKYFVEIKLGGTRASGTWGIYFRHMVSEWAPEWNCWQLVLDWYGNIRWMELLTISIGLVWKYTLDGKLGTLTIAFPDYVPGHAALAVTPKSINLKELSQLEIYPALMMSVRTIYYKAILYGLLNL